MVKTIFPERLPCNAAKPFVVTLEDPLPPGVGEFTLVFKGKRSKKRSQGNASRLDAKTLLATTGLHDEAEEVSVTTTAVGKSFRVDSFKLVFEHAFSSMCDLLPDSASVHVAAALAQCLPDDFVESRVLDDELEKLCDRLAIPDDLTMSEFFGVSCRWTLLHFAAKRNLPKFAAQLLVRSSGATTALRASDDAGATPSAIALENWKDEEICQVFEEYKEAEEGTSTKKTMSKKKSALHIAVEKHEKKASKDKPKLFKRLTDFAKRSSIIERKSSFTEKTEKVKGAYFSKSELETKLQTKKDADVSRSRPLPLPPPAPLAPMPPKEPPPPEEETFDEVLPVSSRPDGDNKIIGKAFAKSNFNRSVSDPPDAISFKVNDVFDVVSNLGNDWLLGFDCKKTFGRIPLSYVTFKKLEDIDGSDDEGGGIYEEIDPVLENDSNDDETPDYYNTQEFSTGASEQDVYVAMYDFVTKEEGQLTIYVGDRLRVLSSSDTGWWHAQLIGNNKRGLIPHNYIQKEQPRVNQSSSRSGGSAPGSSRNSSSSYSSGGNRSGVVGTLPKRTPSKNAGLGKGAAPLSKSLSVEAISKGGGIAKMVSNTEQVAASQPPPSRRDSEESPVPSPIYGRGLLKPKSKTADSRSETAPPEVRPTSGSYGVGSGPSSISALKAKLDIRGSSSAPTTPLTKRKIAPGASEGPPLQSALKAKIESLTTASAGSSSVPVKRKGFGDSAGTLGRHASKPGALTDSPIFQRRRQEVKEKGNPVQMGAAAAPPPPPPKTVKQKWKVLYDYADNDSGLFVKAGDILTDVDLEISNDDWLYTTIGQIQGFVPSTYVSKI